VDSLKLIPQFFFDLIGRVVPGGVALVATLLLSETTWQSWLHSTLGDPLASESVVAALLSFVVASYVVGQLLSPAAKLVQRIGELEVFRPAAKAHGYDWLRLHHPKAGAHCAKIRAEFTMHNGVAAVLAASAVAYPFTRENWRLSVLALLVFGAVVAAVRGRMTRDTFNEAVDKFRDAADNPPAADAGG
jgi:hypothetical protein